MAAPPRLGATLLLLLLLAAPPPGGGNEGGALGLCKCLRLTSPPSRLQDLADKVRAAPGPDLWAGQRQLGDRAPPALGEERSRTD
ncbi:C-X-C motif chemokine 16 isoform X2 [Chrysemys picta bellii]|uniref:C-X-C motif chemokine 16 isoform X2 n=1 Tax=Chrysemys picta bellii TaxID=8478 RepID=UPI0032B24764